MVYLINITLNYSADKIQIVDFMVLLALNYLQNNERKGIISQKKKNLLPKAIAFIVLYDLRNRFFLSVFLVVISFTRKGKVMKRNFNLFQIKVKIKCLISNL